MTEPVWKARKRNALALPWTFTVYSLSEEKITVDTGVFTLRQEEVRLYRVLDVTLVRTFGQRIFGMGTIKCLTADRTAPSLEIKNIRNCKDVKERLSDLVEAERARKRVMSREEFDGDGDDFDGH